MNKNQLEEFQHSLDVLANWAMNVVPTSDVKRRAAIVLFDNIAAMLAARNEPELTALRDGLLRHTGVAEASIFDGRGSRADRYTAAVANAAAGNWCELDEGYRATPCHAGLYTVPALLAEAEAEGHTFGALVRALAIAYEITVRFALTFPGVTDRLHPHAAFASIGAAAAIARLRNESPETLKTILESASTFCIPGPFDHAVEGALIRNVWPAVATWSGMRAADWVQMGILATRTSPIEVFQETIGARLEAEELSRGLGQQWAILNNFQKVYACCQYAHATVEATLALRAQLSSGPIADAISSIKIETHPRACNLDNYMPTTTLAAKFSVPHVAAATAVLGHARADAFTEDALQDPRITALRNRVSMLAFAPLPAPPEDRPTRVTWNLKDGTHLEEVCLSARGGPDRPYSIDDILEKIAVIVTPVYPHFFSMASEITSTPETFESNPWQVLLNQLVAR